ncbi:MAG: metallophosphoesterase family protein [Candidatus Omnitrophota bacterium]
MKIAVISDTHLTAQQSFPSNIINCLKDVDLILHAGDIVELNTLREIEKYKPVIAVSGNMDSADIKRLLPEKRLLDFCGFKIGLMHGHGPAYSVLDQVKDEFKTEENLSCVIYGHSHAPCITNIGGVIYLNPGSLTDKVYAPYNSYAILDIGKKIKAKIIKIA